MWEWTVCFEMESRSATVCSLTSASRRNAISDSREESFRLAEIRAQSDWLMNELASCSIGRDRVALRVFESCSIIAAPCWDGTRAA